MLARILGGEVDTCYIKLVVQSRAVLKKAAK